MKIEWAEPALLDLEGIRDYIRKDSEYYARRFLKRLSRQSRSSQSSPESGVMFPRPMTRLSANLFSGIIVSCIAWSKDGSSF